MSTTVSCELDITVLDDWKCDRCTSQTGPVLSILLGNLASVDICESCITQMFREHATSSRHIIVHPQLG